MTRYIPIGWYPIAPANKAYRKAYDGIDWSRERRWALGLPPPPRQGVQIVTDIPEFVDPIEGKLISGRTQRREFMRKHNVHDVGDDRATAKPEPMSPVGPDVKRAYEELEAG